MRDDGDGRGSCHTHAELLLCFGVTGCTCLSGWAGHATETKLGRVHTEARATRLPSVSVCLRLLVVLVLVLVVCSVGTVG